MTESPGRVRASRCWGDADRALRARRSCTAAAYARARARLDVRAPSRSTARRLAEFVGSRDASWRGLSLTMPLKQACCRCSTSVDELAVLTGAVNTLLLRRRPASRVQHRRRRHRRALGEAGRRARAARRVHHRRRSDGDVGARRAGRTRRPRGCEVVARRRRRPPSRSPTLGASPRHPSSSVSGLDDLPRLDDADLVVSTLPGGADARRRGIRCPRRARRTAARRRVRPLADRPRRARGTRAGGRGRHGLGMLLHQALLQVRIFVGGDPDAALPDEAAVLAAMRRWRVVGD